MSHDLKGTLGRRRRVIVPPPSPETLSHPFLSALPFLNSCTCRPQLDLPPPPPIQPQAGTDGPGSMGWYNELVARGPPRANTCPVHGAPSLLKKKPLRTPPRRGPAHQPDHNDSVVETTHFYDSSSRTSTPIVHQDGTSICSKTLLLLVLLCCALLFKLRQE